MGQTAAEPGLADKPPLAEGQIVSGAIFSEPVRVETIRANGPGLWEIGVSGVHTERFRRVTLPLAEIGKLQVAQPTFSSDNGTTRPNILRWTRERGHSPRLHPAALIWCARRPGRDLRTKVEAALAWRKVQKEYSEGSLAGEFDQSDREEITAKLGDAEESAKDEVWAAYRYIILYDNKDQSGLQAIDLGAGHASQGETLSARVLTTLKQRALLNDSPGAGYLERRWPDPFKKSGAWPLSALRQAFLNGTLERVLDPDTYLRSRLNEFVQKGDFGFASGQKPEGGYSRVRFKPDSLPAEEIAFDSDVYLLLPNVAQAYKDSKSATLVVAPHSQAAIAGADAPTETLGGPLFDPPVQPDAAAEQTPAANVRKLHISGEIPTEVWQRLGRTLIPKLKSGNDLRVALDVSLSVSSDGANGLRHDIEQILEDLKLEGKVKLEWK